MYRSALFLILSTTLMVSAPASAHKPFFSNGDHTNPGSAFGIEDITTSIVLYHEASCDAPQLWMQFETEEPDEPIFLQLGIPVLDWLEDYRPSIALIAQGLPIPARDDAERLPFVIPEGLGVSVWNAEEEREFFEPFTNTNSLILVEQTVTLPVAGRGYVVAWHPEFLTGKFWAAVGTEERFGPDDFAELPRKAKLVQTFHEVGETDLSNTSVTCPN